MLYQISLQEERHKNERAAAACRKLLEECESLCNQLQECNVDILNKEEDGQVMDFPSSSDALDHIAKFDDQINQLLAEVFLKLYHLFLSPSFPTLAPLVFLSDAGLEVWFNN